MKRLLGMTVIVFACGLTWTHAAIRNWLGGDGTWDNATTAVWSGGAVPGNTDTVNITNAAAGNLSVTFDASNLSGNGLGSLTIGNTGGGVNTLAVAAGDFLPTAAFTLSAGGQVTQSDGYMIVSTTGNSTFNGGTLTLSGGTNQTQVNSTFSAGRIQQSGGVFRLVSGDLSIRTTSASATATYDQSGGTNQIRMMYVGEASSTGGTNIYNLSGSGYLTTVYDVGIGNGAGPSLFTQSGGQFLPGRTVYIYSNATYTLGGGYFSVGTLTMNGGRCIQSGGIGYVSSGFTINSGQFDFNSGIFTSRLVTLVGTVGGGDAVMTVTGRTMAVKTTVGTTEINLGGGSGHATLTLDDTLWTGGGGTLYVYANGTFNIRGGGMVTNLGYLTMSGGSVNQSGDLLFTYDREIGTLPGSAATCVISSGYHGGRYLELGCSSGGATVGGAGTLIQTGGVLRASDWGNPANPGIYISHPNASVPSIWVLKGGVVTNDTATLNVFPFGTLQGYGALPLGARALRSSGRIIADGDGVDRTLDLSSFNSFTNPVDNTTNRGWFAVSGGKLLLPSFPVTTAAASYNWGESVTDTSIDLISSARIAFSGLSGAGTRTFTGALLASNRSDVVLSFPGTRIPISIHDFSLSGASPTFTSFTVTVRYDDAAITARGLNENTVRLWQYVGGTWVNVSSVIDTAAKTIRSISRTAFSQFAVTVDLSARGTVVCVK